MQIIEFKQLEKIILKRNIVIYGAGNYGGKLCIKLKCLEKKMQIVFCDNNKDKQNTTYLGCRVYSVDDVLSTVSDPIFVFGVESENQARKWSTCVEQLETRGILPDDIYAVRMDSLVVLSIDKQFNNSKSYIADMKSRQKPLESLENVKEIKSITFRNRLVNGTGGGPAKVLEMQESLLGNEYENLCLSYCFREENKLSLSVDYLFSTVLGAIEFGYQTSLHDKDTVYIVHDIFSAYGLAINGKRYVLVYHSQGEYVYESRNFGKEFSREEEEFIKEIELFSILNAYAVCFPSKGAEIFFWESWGIENVPNYSRGSILYNTLIEENLIEKTFIENIEEDETINILSIGQMTYAKGMDRIPKFLNELSIYMQKRIKWIVVANGVLKDNIIHELNGYIESNPLLSFVQFDSIDHNKINYLFSVSDIYLMLHRISIFDLATLEAMYNDLKIVLSEIPGNTEYNVNNNIILVKDEDVSIIAEQLKQKYNNKECYDRFFSQNVFIKRYREILQLLVKG